MEKQSFYLFDYFPQNTFKLLYYSVLTDIVSPKEIHLPKIFS